MEIIISDRESVERGLRVRAGCYALISISNPGRRRVRIRRQSALRAVLELRFHDAEPTTGFQLPLDIKPMTEDHAKQIAAFVLQHHKHINALVIHCEAGMSRSPAVGAAIAQALNLDTTPYDRDFQPNAYVRELTAKAFDSLKNVMPGPRGPLGGSA